MRIRSIKPEFWRSDDITALEIADRLLFIGLWSYVDDNGVGKDKLADICADLFAADLERDPRETFARVSRGILNLTERGLLRRYSVANRPFLEVVSWKDHQRIDKPGKARFPASTSEDAVFARVSRECRESVAPGAVEQGNRGTEDQGLKTPTAAAPPKISYTVEFQRWWSTYPRRDTGKADAAKAYEKARKIVDAETLLDAAQRYAQDPNLPETQFIPHGAKWLNGKRWEDGPCPPRTDRRPTGGERAQRILEQGRALAAETQQMELR